MTDTISSNNTITPFHLETSHIRGRIVRLDSVLDDILIPHNYPFVISRLLVETITLCALLSSMLKFEGIFTLQASGNGAVSMLVTDITSQGEIRGCASFDPQRIEDISNQLSTFAETMEKSSDNHLLQLLGKGYLAFTVDQEGAKDMYQGIVDLKGRSLVDCVQYYFKQSEQIETGIMMAVEENNGRWKSSGLMVQRMPTEGGETSKEKSNVEEDDWRRAMLLMQSCTQQELLSDELDPQELLYRLFHEEGIRVYSTRTMKHQCRCNRPRVENIVNMMLPEDLEEMMVDNKIIITCEFCSRSYEFNADDISKSKG